MMECLPFWEYGIKKIAQGMTTVEEVLALTDEHQLY